MRVLGMNNTDMTTAQTILHHLGGHKFLTMTGAKNLVSGECTLSMQLPAALVTGRANGFYITLAADDTYTLELLKVSKRNGQRNVAQVAIERGVYCNQLQEAFTRMTGMFTSL